MVPNLSIKISFNQGEFKMNHTFSNHSLQRFQQRGFTKEILDILEYFGDIEHVVGNAEKISISKRGEYHINSLVKKMIRYLERN